MKQRLVLHIIDGNSRSRAEQARTAFALGHHAEVYSDLEELFERPPFVGVILLHQRAIEFSLGGLFERLGGLGVWLPLIVCDQQPQLDHVVGAIKDGALDYLQLPLEVGRLARSLAGVVAEADANARERRRVADARRRVARLSKREREVLELLSLGKANKTIARELAISPRTVEIHRSNMMTKLNAGHAAEAVRLWLQSGFEADTAEQLREYRYGPSLTSCPDFTRMIRDRMSHVTAEEVSTDAEQEPARTSSRRAGSH